MSILKHWPISRRITVGLGALGGCLIFSAGVTLYSLSSIADAFDDYVKASHEVEAVDQIYIRTADFVGAAKEYAARNTSRRYGLALDRFADLEAAKEAARAVTDSQQFQQGVENSSRALLALRQSFEDMAGLRQSRNDIVNNDLRDFGSQLHSQMQLWREQANDRDAADLMGDATMSLLLSGDYMNRYLSNFDEASLTRSYEEIRQARDIVSNIEAAPANIMAGLASFEASLGELQHMLSAEQSAANTFFDVRLVEATASINAMIDIAHHEEDEALNHLSGSKQLAYILIAIAMLQAAILGIAIAIALSKSIAPPVRVLTKQMRRLADGELDITTPGDERRDELGEMARALGVLRENSAERMRLESDRIERAQKARHHQDVIDQLVAMFGKSIEGVMGSFNKSSAEMGGMAKSMNDTADETHGLTNSVAVSMSQARDAVQTIASAAQEMTSSVSEIGEQASRTSQMSKNVRDSADKARNDVNALGDAVSKISGIVGLINEIAEQTNLLALNATIESARAGEAGKGFAVVASEVKALASQTSSATEEISAAIAGVGAMTDTAMAAMENIHQAISELDEVADTVAAASEEQRAATEEIARSAAALATETDSITTEIDQVSSAGARTRQSAQRVNDLSGDLADEADVLSEEVHDFLAGIGDAAVREVIVPQSVHMPASLKHADGRAFDITIMRISPACAEIKETLEMTNGDRLTLTLPEFGAIPVRVTGTSERGTRLQLPMERTTLDRVEKYLMQAIVKYQRDDQVTPLAA